MTYRSVHKRRDESWILNPHKFCLGEWRTESWGWTGDYLQFLCCQGGGSSLSSYSSVFQVQWAVLTDPLGQAQSVISAQVAHCWGAQVANKSVWETAGGRQGGEVARTTDSDSVRSFLFFQRMLFSSAHFPRFILALTMLMLLFIKSTAVSCKTTKKHARCSASHQLMTNSAWQSLPKAWNLWSGPPQDQVQCNDLRNRKML